MLNIGLVGLGVIARAQHLPAIAANPSMRLAAIASSRGNVQHAIAKGAVQLWVARPFPFETNVKGLCGPPFIAYTGFWVENRPNTMRRIAPILGIDG